MGKAPDKIRARVAARKKAKKKAQKKAAPSTVRQSQVRTQPGPKNSSTNKKAALKAPARPKSKRKAQKSKASTSAQQPPPPQTPEERKAKRREYDRKRRADRKAKLEGLAAKATRDARINMGLAEMDTAKTGNKRGMRAFVPSVDDRRQVQTLAGLGIPLDQIRVLILNPRTGKPVSEEAFKERFQRELVAGPAVVNSQIAAALLKSAKGHTVEMKGGKKGPLKIKYVAPSVQAQIWLSKVRLGWTDEQRITVDVKSGVLVAPQSGSVQDWLVAVAERNAAAVEPGTEGD